VEIRKAKREENLAKRRGITGGDIRGAALGAAPESDDDTAPTESQVCLSSYFMLHNPAICSWVFVVSATAPLLQWHVCCCCTKVAAKGSGSVDLAWLQNGGPWQSAYGKHYNSGI
jgi:hypothetical protein